MPRLRLPLALLTAALLASLAASPAAHAGDDHPASAYEIRSSEEVSLSVRGFDGAATLDEDGAYLDVEVANDGSSPIRNLTVTVADQPAGIEVTKTEAHASAVTPNETVLVPHIEAGGTASFGLGLDVSGADPGGMDLGAVIVFQDGEGSWYAARDTISLSLEGSLGIPAPSAALAASLLAAAAVLPAGARRR